MTKMTTIQVNYNNIRAEIVELLNAARSAASRSVNAVMTAKTLALLITCKR